MELEEQREKESGGLKIYRPNKEQVRVGGGKNNKKSKKRR